MKVFSSIDEVGNEFLEGAIAIGNFDGLHLGHQALIEKLCKEYTLKKRGVLTFFPYPREILNKSIKIFKIISEEKKIDLFKNWPLDILIQQKIDKSFLDLTPEIFVKNLKEKLKISHIIVGDDFRFGKSRSADVVYLKRLTSLYDIDLEIVDELTIDGIRCSSTHIRNILENGEIEIANKFLSRYFSVEGIVVKGQQRGAAIGFKTANLICPSLRLKSGVYKSMTKICMDDKESYFNSITNVGTRPTFYDSKEIVVETHLINIDMNLYGQKIEVSFLKRIRDERKFSSIENLKAQIMQDIAVAKTVARV